MMIIEKHYGSIGPNILTFYRQHNIFLREVFIATPYYLYFNVVEIYRRKRKESKEKENQGEKRKID